MNHRKREMEMELNKDELVNKVEESKKLLAVLSLLMESESQKSSVEGELQWPLVAAGSVGVAALVAATLFVCYSKKMWFE